jgi:hypothetical protein
MRQPLACKIKEVLELRKLSGRLNLLICAAVGVALLLPCYTLASERQDLVVSWEALSNQSKELRMILWAYPCHTCRRFPGVP